MADIGTAYFRVAPNMSGVQSKIASGLKGTGSQFGDQFGKELGTRSSVIFGAIAGITQAATQKAINLISSSVSDAVSRVDILNNFPKVLSNMGIGFDDATKASNKLEKGLRGLPTTLDTGTLAVQRLTTKTQDVSKATDIFLAFNNAVLAGGAPMELQATATEQFAQAFSKGKPDMMEWRSMLAAMPAQLQQVSKQLGMKSVDAFGEALRNGDVTMGQFADALIKLNSKGVGGLPTLQQQAKNATAGIGTSMAVMKTAITRGLADIMKTIGTTNISNSLVSIGNAFEKVLKGVSSGIKFIAANKDIFAPIGVAIGVIVTGLTAWAAVTKTITIAQAAFNAVMALNPIGLIIIAVAGLVAGLTYFFTKTETGRKLFAQFTAALMTTWNAIKTGASIVASFFSGVWSDAVNAVTTAKDGIFRFAGVVAGYVSGAINTLNNALQATVGWFVQNYKWFMNIGIVVGTVLLPLIVKLGIEAVKSAAKWVASMAQAGASSVKAGAQTAASFARAAATATVSAVKTGAAWSVAAVQTSIAWLKALPGMIAGFIQASAAATVNAVKSGAAWVLAATQSGLAWLKTITMYLAQVALAAAQTLLAGARMALGWMLAMGPIGLVVAAVVGAVALIIANWDKVGPFFTGLWNGIKNIVAGVINWIKANWSLILAIITGPVGLAVRYVIQNWQRIKDGAANMISGLIGFFSGLPGRVLRAIGNMGSLLYNSGRDLINGLLNGAGSLLSKIGNFFLDKLPGWIKTPFKKALGIASPSKVFAGFGQNITEGLSGGINSNQRMVQNAAGNMTDSVLSGYTNPAFSPSVAFGGGAGIGAGTGNSSTTNQSVSIQKIVLGDESAVKEFFKQLNRDTISVGMGITPNQGAI